MPAARSEGALGLARIGLPRDFEEYLATKGAPPGVGARYT